MPALLTPMVSRPHLASTASTMACTWSGWVTSAWMAMASICLAASSCAAVFGQVQAQVDHGDGGAGLAQGVGEGAADALGAAGHQGDAAVQAEAFEDGFGFEYGIGHGRLLMIGVLILDQSVVRTGGMETASTGRMTVDPRQVRFPYRTSG